ncbi:MAG: oxygen-insensitive NADPH nitroreductase [Anaerolineaceae bacterium]|nr:oxygen-insensitive NADPH nitroreductase [Anaerolineaceae bacterium]
MNQVISLLKKHRSVRQFKPESVSREIVHTIIEAAGWAATSNFIQAYTVIRVINPEKRKRIASLAGGQTWVETSPVFLIFCADLNRAKQACIYENKVMLPGYTEQFIIATVDVTLAAQNAMIAAESLGLGGVYIGGIRNDPATVCSLLHIPEHVYPVFGMCLGYPVEQQEQKPRLPVNMILHEDTYQADVLDLKKYNKICHDYYQGRSKTSRDETWTHQIAEMMSKPARSHMRAFLEQKGFELK